jgi:hypothetical protein
MAGFYSKDLIMEASININNNLFIVLTAFLSLGLTSFYSIRFRLVVLWGPNLCNSFTSIKEENKIIIPTILLGAISVIAGRSIRWIILLTNQSYFIPFFIKIAPLVIVTTGLILAWVININYHSINLSMSIKISIIHAARCIIWFLVPLSSQFIMKAPLNVAHAYIKIIDQGWFERLSGQGRFHTSISTTNTILSYSPKHPTLYLSTSITLIFASLFTIVISLS